jgi:hypothetical protein
VIRKVAEEQLIISSDQTVEEKQLIIKSSDQAGRRKTAARAPDARISNLFA